MEEGGPGSGSGSSAAPLPAVLLDAIGEPAQPSASRLVRRSAIGPLRATKSCHDVSPRARVRTPTLRRQAELSLQRASPTAGQGGPSSWGALQLGSAARVRWSSALELQNKAEGERSAGERSNSARSVRLTNLCVW